MTRTLLAATMVALLLGLAATALRSATTLAAVPSKPRIATIRPWIATTRRCNSRVESGNFVDGLPAFFRRQIRAGPLVLVARNYTSSPASSFMHVPNRPQRYYPQKLLVLVRAGASVVLAVAWSERNHVGLLYDPSKWGRPYGVGFAVADGDRAVRFRACAATKKNFQGDGVVGKWTEFNGGVIVAGARCAAFDVYRTGRTEPSRRVVSFGRGECS